MFHDERREAACQHAISIPPSAIWQNDATISCRTLSCLHSTAVRNRYPHVLPFCILKVGSMAIFDSWGVRHPVTVLQLDECEVVQVRYEYVHCTHM